MRVTKTFIALVEDDNGRYFNIEVEALDTYDAKQRVSYILDKESARIVAVRVG